MPFNSLLDEHILVEDDKTKISEGPTQNKIIRTLNLLNESIASFATLNNNLGLNAKNKTQPKSLMVEKAIAEKKLNRLKCLDKSQQKLRKKRKHIIKEIALECHEVVLKLKKLDFKQKARRKNF